MTLRRRMSLALSLCAAGLVFLTPPLAAQPAGDGADWLVVAGPVPLFDFGHLAPGAKGQAQLVVTNQMPSAAQLSVQVVDLRSDDVGCNEPEADAGDTSCGQDEGELDDALELALDVAGSEDGDARSLGTDVIRAWDGVIVDDTVALAPGEQRTYTVRYELPRATTDIVQSDRVSFVLELALDQAAGADVAGATISRPAAARIAAAPELPRTGSDLLGPVRVGTGAIAVGCVALLLAGRRREPR